MLKIRIISCLHHGIFVITPLICIGFWGHFQIHLDYLLCPLHYLMHDNPPTVFESDPRVVPSGTILFFSLQHIYSGLGGRTGFISQIISCWDAIR